MASTSQFQQPAAPEGNRAAQFVIVAVFLFLTGSVMLLQTASELIRGTDSSALALLNQKPTAANLRAYEKGLEDASVVARALRPWLQWAQFVWLRDAGDKALAGRAGWMFYKPGYDDMISREPKLVPGSTNDPLGAILAFRNDLAARGIQLLVVPVPNKESVYPHRATARFTPGAVVAAPASRELIGRLEANGVETVDLFALFAEAVADSPEPLSSGPATGPSRPGANALYLAQDSHWSPRGMELAAKAVADRLLKRGWVERGATDYSQTPVTIKRTGDILRMLKFPLTGTYARPEETTCAQVIQAGTGKPYKDDPGAQILVLGDSFLRIYQQDEPGSAGFISHLARELDQPLWSLVNDGGASTLVRQELHRRAALLKGKKVVVWEFVERDIRLGLEGWKIVRF